MKIFHVLNTFAPAGGIETYVLDLLPLLAARGHENIVLFRQPHPRTPNPLPKGVYHVPVSADGANDRRQIRAIVQAERPSHLYLHDVYDPILMGELADMAPAIGYVHIFYPVCPGLGKLYHRGDAVCERPFGWGCVPQIYLRRCASAKHPLSVLHILQKTAAFLPVYQRLPRVIVASQYMKRLMVQNGVAAERVAVLPYFIPIPEPALLTPPQKSTAPNVVFAGRLVYEKGLPYLLEAIARLPQATLLVAGDGDLRPSYEAQAQQLGIADRVQFAPWLGARELEAAYRAAIVTVMPSIMPEPFGKVGVEAMANGRPVVAFNVGGIPDWLHHEQNGYLVPAGDVAGLASRLEQLLSNLPLADQLGRNGRLTVETHYTTTTHLTALEDILTATT